MQFLLIALLILAGCSNDQKFDHSPSYINRSLVIYKHPVTKEFKECNIDAFDPSPLRMFETMEDCKNEYEGKGYRLFTEH